MPKASSEFPPDEFDVVDPTSPRAPHRAPKSRLRRTLPFLAALILGPALAYVIVTAVTTGELPGQSRSTPTAQVSGDTITPTVSPDHDEDPPSEDPSAEDPSAEESTDSETTEEPSSEEPEAEPDTSTRVLVLNSTQTAGLAGRGRDALAAAGWSDVVTGNYSGALPGSTVFYAEDDPVLEASARAVAEELGIETVELDAEIASEDPITVVLEADFE